MIYSISGTSDHCGPIKHSLEANSQRLYHNRLSVIKRSTLADTMKNRDYRIFVCVYEMLLEKANLLSGREKRRLENPLRIIESMSIEVNITRFPWVKFRHTKGGIKRHMSYGPETASPDQVFDTLKRAKSNEKPLESLSVATFRTTASLKYVESRRRPPNFFQMFQCPAFGIN